MPARARVRVSIRVRVGVAVSVARRGVDVESELRDGGLTPNP